MRAILTLVIFINAIFNFGQNDSSDKFRIEAEDFIRKYNSTHSIVSSNLDGSGYQWTLDKKTKHSWIKKQTLQDQQSTPGHVDKSPYNLYFAFYQYENELVGSSAFDSLTKCFPNDCFKLAVGQNVPALKARPAIYVVNKTNIVTGHTDCQHVSKRWQSLQNDLILTFAKSNSIIISTGCGGPLVWKFKD